MTTTMTPNETFYHFAKRANDLRIDGPVGHMFSDVSRDDEFPKQRCAYREYHDYISEKSRYDHLVIRAFEDAYAFYINHRFQV